LKILALKAKMVIIDLKMKDSKSHTSAPQRKEMAYNEFWQNYFYTAYGISPNP
jgi:hypothetical protein